VNGSNDARLARGIAEGVPNLVDDPRQARLGDEHTRPDTLEEIRFRERARPRLDEQLQQLERLRWQMDLARSTEQSSRIHVEPALTEPERHASSSGFTKA